MKSQLLNLSPGPQVWLTVKQAKLKDLETFLLNKITVCNTCKYCIKNYIFFSLSHQSSLRAKHFNLWLAWLLMSLQRVKMTMCSTLFAVEFWKIKSSLLKIKSHEENQSNRRNIIIILFPSLFVAMRI